VPETFAICVCRLAAHAVMVTVALRIIVEDVCSATELLVGGELLGIVATLQNALTRIMLVVF